MGKKTKYLNFPIQLLEGFLDDHKDCLDKILKYAAYDYACKLLEKNSDILSNFKDAGSSYGVQWGSCEVAYKDGAALNNKYDPKSEREAKPPKVGINLETFREFYFGSKSEFEVISLASFLALKSIIHNKPLCKVTNLYWLSRMDGKTHCVESNEDLYEEVQKLANEYQLKKIKSELIENWGLVHYARYTRGFYISFKIDLEKLVYHVEKKRKSYQLKTQKKNQDLALAKALSRLENEEIPSKKIR